MRRIVGRRPSVRLLLACCLSIIAAILVAPTVGQNRPQFGAGVDLIPLDVSVIDKNHQPVRGLTQADFTLLENGQPQAIQAFASIDLPEEPPKISGWMRDIAPDVTANTNVDEERLIVIVLDDFAPDVSADLWTERSAKVVGKGIIERLGPRDLAAVVYTVASQHNQEFTHDRARLLAAVEKFTPASSLSGPSVSTGILQRICDVLGSVPQRRKVMVWVTPGVIPPGEGLGPFTRAAQLANVNVYPIDPAGLRVPDVDTTPRGTTNPTSVDAMRANVERTTSLSRLRGLEDVLRATAANTGGHAFQWNEFTKSLNQVFRETGSFYLLGYVSTNRTPDGKLRRLDVKVNRKDVTVNARKGHYGPLPADAARDTTVQATPAFQALSGLVPTRGVPLSITAVPLATADTPAVAVVLGIPAVEGQPDDVRIDLRAFTFNGVEKLNQTLRVAIPAGTSVAREHQVMARFDLTPGRYQIRAGVQSARRAEPGSVYADLEVPDFAKAPLSMSGVVLSPATTAFAGDVEALRRLLPVMPSTVRTFSASTPVAAFVAIYQTAGQPAQPVNLATTIRSDSDKRVFEQTVTVEAARFASGSAEHRFMLPLTPLAPGEYLLTFETKAGRAAARRDVRFAVK